MPEFPVRRSQKAGLPPGTVVYLRNVYGMNFRNSPEIEWPFGYAFLWLICEVVVILMLLYFPRKRWLQQTNQLAMKRFW